MGNLGVWSFLFLALLSTSVAQEIKKYFKVGGQLELDPEFKGPITNIVWKHEKDLVAEWIQKQNILDYYGGFNNRTTLDTKTGRLTMKGLTDADQGTFSVELNHRVQPQRYISKAILEVPEPKVVVRPLACHIDSQTECSLNCEDPTGLSITIQAEPVTYSWREEDGQWQTGDQQKNITKAGMKHIEEYSCKMSNPVSDKASRPQKNPFFVEKIPPEPRSSNVGTAVGVSVGIILAAAAAGVGVLVWMKKVNIPFLSSNRGADINGHKPPSSGEASTPQPEAVPLSPSPTSVESG